MILSRELGKRIWGGSTNMENGGGGVSSDAIAGLLAGYATESWVDEHYISIDFFSRLFQAHGTENGSEIDVMPNDMETTITSVESMFGFWTNLYISALGSNGAAPAGISLGMLTDVVISGTPSAGQVLTFDAVTQKWVNANAQAGATALANLTDVTLTSLQTNQILIYDAVTQKWINSSVKTINGYSIFGTGDIPASGGGGGNYLPLNGGTMTGANPINFTVSKVALDFRPNYEGYSSKVEYMTFGNEALVFSNQAAVTSFIFKCGLNLTNRNDWNNITPSLQIKNQSVYINYLLNSGTSPAYNLYVNGSSCISDTLKVAGINFEQNNEINCDYSSMHLNYRVTGYVSICQGGGNVGIRKVNPSYELDVNGTVGANNISIQGNGRINLKGETTDYLYIGNSNNHGWVAIQDMCSSNGYQYWQITTNGNSVFANVLSNGYITALSDARKKDITGEAGVTVEQIAHAPAVQFLWKDKERRKDGQQVGTLAQYWQTVLPEVVMDKGGELSMQYGVAALVSAIITARKVVDHERRIYELEKENERLKKEISQLRLLN